MAETQCPKCKGSGIEEDSKTCRTCNGRGYFGGRRHNDEYMDLDC